MSREFYVSIEKDEDGFFIGEVPQLKACYSQGKTIDELMANMKEVIALALEEQGDVEPAEFVGVQKLMVNISEPPSSARFLTRCGKAVMLKL